MTTTAWAHLPNAAHIDRVIASVKANPEQWLARAVVLPDWLPAWSAARGMVLVQVRNAAWDAARDASWAVVQAAREAAWAVARDAIVALIAYDDCAYMLESDPGELAILAAFGDPRAVLLLPACKVFHSIKDIV